MARKLPCKRGRRSRDKSENGDMGMDIKRVYHIYADYFLLLALWHTCFGFYEHARTVFDSSQYWADSRYSCSRMEEVKNEGTQGKAMTAKTRKELEKCLQWHETKVQDYRTWARWVLGIVSASEDEYSRKAANYNRHARKHERFAAALREVLEESK